MQSEDPATDESRSSGFALRTSHSPHFLLTLLTVFAGCIRFYHLSHPCLWYDESMVFWRTCGSYGQLLDCLRTDGFVPLHYSLIWVITRVFHPSPVILRFVPALCGTLMVPAIYFLARQLLTVPTAMLAAAFAACSGFLLFYSRDAKMYMDAWLFVTLNMGCLLWWFGGGKSTAWLCWIASGCAACGLHASSAIPIGISLLLLFTQSTLRWQQMLLWLVGIVVIFSGPIGYYEKFNRWEDRVDEDGWKDSGLQWIGAYNQGRTDPQLVRYLGTSTVMGWEWPKDEDLNSIQMARVNWPECGAAALLGILILGCLPWPSSPNRHSEKIHPQWRIVLWLSFWIVLPVYGFYCHSVSDFASPADYESYLAPTRLKVVLAAALIAAFTGLIVRYPRLRPPVYRGLKLLLVCIAILALCQGIASVATSLSQHASYAGNPWQSLWVPRYIGFIWPALAIAVAALIMRLPTRYFRVAAIVFLLTLNLSIAAYRIVGQTEPPVDLMAADFVAGENPSHQTLTWMHIKRGQQYPGGGNLFSGPGEYYLDLLENRPATPPQFRKSMRDRLRAMNTFPLRKPPPAQLTRIIIWNQYDVDAKPASEDLLPAGWTLESENWFNVRDCWIYRDLGRYQRRTFIKQQPGK